MTALSVPFASPPMVIILRLGATTLRRCTISLQVKGSVRSSVLVDHSMPRSEELYIRSVCFSPDGRYLATGADDGNIRIWSTHTSTLHKRLSGHTASIYSLDYSPDGRLLVSSSGDKTVRVWNTDDLHNDLAVQGEERVFVIDIAGVQVDRTVTSIAISPNNSLIAVATLENTIRIWDIESRVLVAQLEGHADSVYSIAFSRDGTELISGSLDRTVKRWDITPLFHQQGAQTCNCTYTYLGHEDYVLCVALTHDVTNHQWVISSSKDCTVKFWDITQRNTAPMPEFTLKGHRNSVIAVDASPVGGLFATAGGDWDAKIWRYTTLQ
ncbi:WD40-repeat-containing domain protein [Gautieria morchelliformis]|nr:WD40-repeat-containing domain protein [Gautieria morchelliformis]